jgi:hypothetical protein
VSQSLSKLQPPAVVPVIAAGAVGVAGREKADGVPQPFLLPA